MIIIRFLGSRICALTLGPAGPSLTAQTDVPQTIQLEHLQFCRSLKVNKRNGQRMMTL